MARERHIDLGTGRAETREVPDEDIPQPDPELTEAFRKKEAALERLRSAALENIDLRDILTLLGY